MKSYEVSFVTMKYECRRVETSSFSDHQETLEDDPRLANHSTDDKNDWKHWRQPQNCATKFMCV